jgi:hypothetical protein
LRVFPSNNEIQSSDRLACIADEQATNASIAASRGIVFMAQYPGELDR